MWASLLLQRRDAGGGTDDQPADQTPVPDPEVPSPNPQARWFDAVKEQNLDVVKEVLSGGELAVDVQDAVSITCAACRIC